MSQNLPVVHLHNNFIMPTQQYGQHMNISRMNNPVLEYYKEVHHNAKQQQNANVRLYQ